MTPNSPPVTNEMWWAYFADGAWSAHHVDVQTQPWVWTPTPPEGALHSLQIALCRVGELPAVIMHAHHKAPERSACWQLANFLRNRFEGAPVLIVLEAKECDLRVDSTFCDDTPQRERAYAAAAVIARSWAWAEGEFIRIADADREIRVDAAFGDDRIWRAEIRR